MSITIVVNSFLRALSTFSNNKEEKLKYLDSRGNVVFTAAYHLSRGYCCKNKCRHCPYKRVNKDNSLQKAK